MTASRDPATPIKATRSDQANNCVEQYRPDDEVRIRDTKERGRGPELQVSRGAYAAVIAGARAGELDHRPIHRGPRVAAEL